MQMACWWMDSVTRLTGPGELPLSNPANETWASKKQGFKDKDVTSIASTLKIVDSTMATADPAIAPEDALYFCFFFCLFLFVNLV